ncbi:MAG TPA: hypothetical protein VD994_15720, partial [Prosthecobacter sp.]|nr:hypothetical protein [Prosthecobacter sp.]
MAPPAGSDVTISVPGSNPTIMFTSAAGTVQINSLTTSEKLTVTGGTLQLAMTLQASADLTLAGGTIKGGTITASGGAALTVTGSGSTLDGVTLNTNVTVGNSVTLTVKNGLVLNATLKLHQDAISYVTPATVTFVGTQNLSGSGQVLFEGMASWASALLYAQGGGTQAAAAVLTIGPGITIRGGYGTLKGFYSYDSILNQGTINADTSGRTITLAGASFSNHGRLQTLNGATLNCEPVMIVNGQGLLSSAPAGNVQFRENLVGNTTAVALSNSQGITTLNGAGTFANPQLLEAMSKDLSIVPAGFTNNFLFGTLALGSNTYVKLVDQNDNAPG